MFFINWYECWTKLYILSNHFKESTGLFMCILGLNSPGFKFHLATLLPLYRVKLLCLGSVYFVKSGLFLLMALVWWYFPKILSVSHCSQKGHCFIICHLPRDRLRKILKIPRTYYIFIKAHWVPPPIQNPPPPPPTFVPASCWQSFVVKPEWMNYLWIIHLCIWNVFGVISIK